MGRKRWWAAAAGVVALSAVILGLTVATGCVSVASACAGPAFSVRDAQDATPDDPWTGGLEEVAPGQELALVGAGFAQCDDTPSAFCSPHGRVEGPRDVAFVWRQPDRPDVALSEGRIEDGGRFAVSAAVPDDASPGRARVVLVHVGHESLDAVVSVTD